MARLAFFGTPAFALPSLTALLEERANGHEVCLVVCQPDRPKGRGKAVQFPPVKELALAHSIEVAQPCTWKKGTPDGDHFRAKLAALDLDLVVVAAYGRILPRGVLALARRGFVNVHGSLLPRWRGAAPVQRAIEAGDEVTGACLMDMVEELDAGDVYASAQIPIAPDDDGESLSQKVAVIGHDLLRTHLAALLEGSLSRRPQPSEGATYAHMLQKEEGLVRWTSSAQDVVNHARAMTPWPGAYTMLDGEVLKLFGPHVHASRETLAAPGTVLGTSPGLVVATGDGAVCFAEAQLPGKRRLLVEELVRGRSIPPGLVLASNE
ncbi:MAG: methionyl-tRNA formyltransferase [Myxococcota bacterium]